MKIVFLDFDGVLNSSSWAMVNNWNLGRADQAWELDPRCVHLLRTLVETTDAYIVVTSTWRQWSPSHMQHWFAYYDWYDAPVIGRTLYPLPVENISSRGKLIQRWLDNTEYSIESYVILDDEFDGMTGMPFVQTDFSGAGLTYNHIDKAAEILTGKKHTQWVYPNNSLLI